MHDYSGKVKLKTNNLPTEQYAKVSDIDENYLQSIDGTGMNIYEQLNNNLIINDKTTSTIETNEIQSIATQSNKQNEVICDLCGRYYTKRGFTRHRNDCVKKSENHLANKKD